MVYGFWAFMMVLFASEIGQRFSNTFEKIDDKINEFDWYLLPMEVQRILPIIMINTQRPTFITCFGSSTCSRDTFKKVDDNDNN